MRDTFDELADGVIEEFWSRSGFDAILDEMSQYDRDELQDSLRVRLMHTMYSALEFELEREHAA